MRQCPRCNVPFEAQRKTFAEIDTCPQCAGTFLDPGEAITALGHRDDLSAVVNRGEARLLGRSEISCPNQHGPMTLYRFGDATSAVEIDVCGTCAGAFFDSGETDIVAEIHARAAGVAERGSFTPPPGNTAQDAAIAAARSEHGKSAFSSFFSDLVSGIGRGVASGARHSGHRHRSHAVKWK